MKHISEIFSEEKYRKIIQEKLPDLFQMAEIESSRAGKIGMEVGTLRERILVAMLIYFYGNENVDIKIPTTEPEVDVKLFNHPISIKTFTGKKFSSIKLIWTVDPVMALRFQKNYIPTCGMLLAQINWEGVGYLHYFTLTSQLEILNKIGRSRYIKLPKEGTNPRGVEISSEALTYLSIHKDNFKLPIKWLKKEIVFDTIKRYIDLWAVEV